MFILLNFHKVVAADLKGCGFVVGEQKWACGGFDTMAIGTVLVEVEGVGAIGVLAVDECAYVE
jgi:hypothetical protein